MPGVDAIPSAEDPAVFLKFFSDNISDKTPVTLQVTFPGETSPGFGWGVRPLPINPAGDDFSNIRWAFERVELYDRGKLLFIIQTSASDAAGQNYLRLHPDQKTFELNCQIPCLIAGDAPLISMQWTFTLVGSDIHVTWTLPWTRKGGVFGHKAAVLPYNSLLEFSQALVNGVSLQLNKPSAGLFLKWFGSQWVRGNGWSGSKSRPTQNSSSDGTESRDIQAKAISLRLPSHIVTGHNVPDASTSVFTLVDQGYLFSADRAADLNNSYFLKLANLRMTGHFWLFQLHQRPSDQWLARHFDASVPLEGAGPITVAALGDASEAWNQMVEQYRLSLEQVNPLAHLCLLPTIESSPNFESWIVRWNTSFDLSSSAPTPRFKLRSIEPYLYNLYTLDPKMDVSGGSKYIHTLRFNFRSNEDKEELPAREDFRFVPVEPGLDTPPDDNVFKFGIGLPQNRPAVLSSFYRLGTLDLQFGGSLPQDVQQKTMYFAVVTLNEVQDGGPSKARFNTHFFLPVLRLWPGNPSTLPPSEFLFENVAGASQDDLKSFKHKSAITIDVDPQPPDTSVRYWAEIRENNPAAYDRSVSIEIHALANGARRLGPPQRIVVLDSNPFLVAEVYFEGFEALSERENDVLARFAISPGNNRGEWVLNSHTRDLYLPPATVGEEMVRANELAFKDTQNKPFDFRFGSATHVHGLNADPAANYTLPPWALENILGFQANRISGAPVASLQFELLYGLTCTTRESGVSGAPPLRLAEMFATLGSIAGPYTETPSKDAATHWNSFAELYSKRFAVLAPDLDGANLPSSAMDPLHVITLDGLKCHLRSEAEEYYQAKPSATDDTYNENAAGLKGGVTWGFEQPQILNAIVRRQPLEPGKGEVVNPYFGAIGGSGFQRVSFENGNDLIVSNTEQARTSFLSIARLGRIAVFGNLARHVIEWERTTVPGHQFEKSQPKFAGRPVIRKVREFIEILEPKLTLGVNTQKRMDCTCVNSIEFKTTKIPVDPNWGSNVGDPTVHSSEQGWKIPLWRRAPKPPTGSRDYFYEKPEIVMNLAGTESANGHTPDVEAVHENPERLFFYTRFGDPAGTITDDPKTWPLISRLDFSEAPVPAPCNGAFQGGTVAETPASEPQIPVGLSAFTYRVSPGHGDVNVVGGRQPASTTFSAVLKNVTLLRNPQQPSLGFAQELIGATQALRGDVFREVRSIKSQGAPSAANVQNYVNALQTRLNNLPSLSTNFIWAREKALIDRWCGLAKSLIDPVINILDAYSKNVPSNPTKEEIVAFVQGHLDDAFAQVAALPDRVLTSTGIVTKIAAAFTHAQAQLILWQKQLNDASTQGDSVFAAAVVQVRDEILHLPDDIRATIEAAIDSWVPCGGVLVHAWDPLLEDLAQRAASVLDQQFDTPASRVAAFKAKTDAAVAGLNDLINCSAAAPTVNLCSSLKQLRADLNVPDVDQYLQVLIDAEHTKATNLLLTTVHNVLDPANGDPNALRAAVAQLVAPVKAQIKNAADNICSTLNGVGQKAATDVFNLVNALVSQAKNEVTGLLNKLIAPALSDIDIAGGLEPLRNKAEEALGRFADNVLASLPSNYPSVDVGQVLSLARALGTPPRMPNLGFNVPQMAYFYPLADSVVNLTPLVSEIKDLGAALAPLSSGLPSLQLADIIKMADLDNFRIGDLLPDFAGLKLSNLFPDVALPPGAKEHIKIRRKFDPPTHTASVNVNIDDLRLTGGTLFSVGPVTLKIDSVAFNANVDIQGSTGGVTKSATGSIVGNWKLNLGDMDVVTFNQSELSFDNSGHVHFSLNPQKMVLNQALGMLQTALSTFVSDPNSGFSIVPSATSILARYVLAIPNIGSLTTGITNLTFGFQLGLEFAPFAITAGLSLGQENAPFNIALYILGGGGYVGAGVRYQPGAAVSCSFAAELAASASFSLSLGPLNGFVGVYLGMSVRYSSGSSGSLRIGIFIMVVGQASLLGIVSVYVQLRLDAYYEKGAFTGRASVEYRIKICWCFTLHVSASVHMTIGSSHTESGALHPPTFWPSLAAVSDAPSDPLPIPALQDYINAATQYINLLNED